MPRRRAQRGETMVEVTLVASLFFAVVFGVITVAYLVFTYNSLSFMAQQGARWASVRGNSSGTPATSATVQAYVLTQGTGYVPGAVTVTTTWSPDENPGSTVTVLVTYNATPLVSTYLPVSMSLTGSSSVAISR